MQIPYYVDGQMIIIEGDTAAELVKHIDSLKEDGTLVMKDCHIEEETLVLE